jgi:hypothetical protein
MNLTQVKLLNLTALPNHLNSTPIHNIRSLLSFFPYAIFPQASTPASLNLPIDQRATTDK